MKMAVKSLRYEDIRVAADLIRRGQPYNEKPWDEATVKHFVKTRQGSGRAKLLYLNGSPVGTLFYEIQGHEVTITCISAIEADGLSKASVVKYLVGYFEDKFLSTNELHSAKIFISDRDPEYNYLSAFTKWKISPIKNSSAWYCTLKKGKNDDGDN